MRISTQAGEGEIDPVKADVDLQYKGTEMSHSIQAVCFVLRSRVWDPNPGVRSLHLDYWHHRIDAGDGLWWDRCVSQSCLTENRLS